MLIGRLPSALAGDLARGPQGLFSRPGLDPALIRAVLGRFGPYRLQPYTVPMLPPSVISARWFQPHGLPDAPAPVARAAMADLGRSGGNGRGVGVHRSGWTGGLLEDPRSVARRSAAHPAYTPRGLLEFGLSLAPVTGNVMSARDAYRAYRAGDALGVGLGVLGMIPGLGAAERFGARVVRAADKATGAGSAIVDFVRQARKTADPGHRINLGLASKSNVEKVLQDTGLDITGFERRVENSKVRHAFTAHGTEATEKPRGQIPITDEDFAKIPDIVDSPDKVFFGKKARDGQEALVYEKRLNGAIYYVEEVRSGKRTLAFTTMYKFPAK